MKFLGVIFDKSLNFKNHIESIKNKVSDRINILKHLVQKAWKLSTVTFVEYIQVSDKINIRLLALHFPSTLDTKKTKIRVSSNPCA